MDKLIYISLLLSDECPETPFKNMTASADVHGPWCRLIDPGRMKG